MKTIEYINENLAPGNLGYFFVVLSFGAAMFSLIAYFFHNRDKRTLTWRNLGRTSFFIHGISVLGIFTVLFYLIKTHQYQYNYVWEHSSDELQPKYIIACFWG
jgi:cytochrome c-type biogenesis protein CcmF